MQQFAKTWNHLLQEFENEKSTLSEKYTNQKRHVTRLEQSLRGAQKNLQKEQQDREALEKRIEAIEAQNETMAQNNQRASLELECLRKSLAESEQKTSKVSERSKSYRSKLNEVIEEQQSLYKQTMMHYQSLAQEIEGERSNLNEKSQKVEEALRESQRKREALLKGCHELQAHKDAEMVRKDIIISNLQENLKEKKQALHAEQQRAERLSNQIDKMHEENEYGLKSMSSKVAEILKLSKESHRDQETNNLLAGAMVESVQGLLHRSIDSPVNKNCLFIKCLISARALQMNSLTSGKALFYFIGNMKTQNMQKNQTKPISSIP
ncbi:hypothetical protein N3K66_004851 [Trichothecium roseum]|uniref:Uncharacterized protein n=1 Tax=Trichothecium roseum TaxID=47278 RepID=A0ACC0V3X0_9HYPO|nr:hypothetical protein N3K66_004851 [Trichothecium roseum]